MKYEYTQSIFKGFSPETLKKYWLMICKQNINVFSRIVKRNDKAINKANLKLRALINKIVSHIERNKLTNSFESPISFETAKKKLRIQFVLNIGVKSLGNKRKLGDEKDATPGIHEKECTPISNSGKTE